VNQHGDRNAANRSATDRHRDGSDQHRHQPGSAIAQWRTEGLDFVREAIRLTYK
jgi:hypothetical protein